MGTYKQWKENLFQCAKTKGITLGPTWDEDMLVLSWNCNRTLEDIFLSHRAGNHSLFNETIVKAGTKCGCFYCLAIFDCNEISEWTDGPVLGGDPSTALCPYCLIDSVLVETSDYKVDRKLLEKLHLLRFSRFAP